jgi:hypothetical protein
MHIFGMNEMDEQENKPMGCGGEGSITPSAPPLCGTTEHVFVNLLIEEPRNQFPAWRVGAATLFNVHRAARTRICKSLWSPGIDSEESISPAYVA